MEKAGLAEKQAVDIAIATHEVWVEDGRDKSVTPEEAVDSDLSYWTD